ncbi:50S ribosomal protein L4 [Candidatus Nomurabacteria bacterium RIFCSPLOWO2_02_40_28]|uniref:Large ribosomal subunit protein uL4 n=2 Tax=Candidatus Nomuraibacteriota TaxID=1752729 RepID=A0A837HRF2_9BACT|nr:MAG: 50S ribosomal protein L4 [Candidatus Nomurabacteria bacterium GW2011_GWC2_39_41]KKR37458.1 MAG: 50S ribosomal protein L4 [Candidatus Nomurabacteria bacterium GW2011_GWE2_40_10]KKR38706.1 MAG: 50S ribosomal protein L4 [Candidatus Nomurabacteria bacterium GW2011_GWB1_40_11]KKR40431.1 MAG: 50S ribosomal protein L4 [Parcubacteria group bacterium GW2011_GWC1_40_11]KKR59460.1 MAG: 50S ribosomal protein L4 [Candidatus Nomurabacteria bacterium GW2011_GWF2_40_31]KKR65144.1 MAG: 50S ribosomal pr
MEAKISKKIYDKNGVEAGSIELPAKVFAAKWRSDLVHQVVEGMRSNKRAGTADTKDRGEVRGGGRKPWKQKGTGRARHGSSRSPIWVGGGVTHGPLAEKNYKRKISKKMRAQALFSVLSRKLKDNEIIFVDSLALTDIKTKQAVRVMENLAKATGFKSLANSKKKRVLIAIYGRSEKTEKSFRNLPQLELVFLKNLNPLDVLNYQYLVIENPKESIEFLESRG